MNSAGKVLDWVLSFEDDAAIGDYFDNVAKRYAKLSLAGENVATRRFRNFPNAQLADIADSGVRFDFPLNDDNEPAAAPDYPAGSLVGKVIGRPVNKDGQPVARTLRQEDYMEATLQVSQAAAAELIQACSEAEEEVSVPDAFIRQLVGPSYLGQLDVSPLIDRGATSSRSHWWQFSARRSKSSSRDLIFITGRSHIAGDAKVWEHSVTLQWQGYVEVIDGQAVSVEMLAKGHERLNWGKGAVTLTTEPDARHLMAGHPIDLDSDVVYGLSARAR